MCRLSICIFLSLVFFTSLRFKLDTYELGKGASLCVMACVPLRAGLDAPREPSIIQGVHSTKHWKMRQALYGSCKNRPQVWHVRGTASQAVIVDDTEASQKKTTRWQRWQAHETMVLITAKQQQELGQLERAEAENGSKRVKKKWEEVEAFCQENGIERTAQQCKDRWDRLMVTYSQIRSWEKTRRPDKSSFWSMKLDERKAEGFLLNLDQETYNALDEVHNSEGRMAVSDVLVENDVEDKPEIGGVDHSLHKYDAKQHAVDEADLGSGHELEHMDEVAVATTGMNALLTYDILQSNEGQQNGALPSDNESGGKVQPVSISNSGPYHLEKSEVDVKDVIENPVSLLKGIEGQNASIMSTYFDNADSVHQNSESGSKHQFLPAGHVVDHTEETAQRMDGTNSVFEHSIEHDCNETKTEWGQATGTTLGLKEAIPVKSVEWREEIQNKKIMSTLLHASPEELGDSYKGQLLHTSPAKVDDCYKDQHQHLNADSLVHHQKELGVKEDITRLVHEGDTSGTTIGMKDAINDDVENPKAMIEGSVSRTMHSNNSIPCAEKTGHNHQEVELRSIQHEFQHAGSFPYHEGSFKGEETCVDKNGNPEKLREEGTGGDSDTIAELEAVTKDGRGTPLTSQKGSEESQSKKTSSSNTEFDDDVFMYIHAAIGNLVKFVSQAIGKFFRL